MKSWLEISAQRLTDNYNVLTQIAGNKPAGEGTAVLAVIKANAYGHGAELCAPVLARAGAPWLGVTDTEEALSARTALAAENISPAPQILIMSGILAEDAETIVREQFVPVVWDQRQLEWLAAAATAQGRTASIHIEIDTGMARQGIVPGELPALLQWLRTQPTLRLDGVMTHFASTEVANSPQTLAQRGLFEQAIRTVAASGLHPAWVHAGNSSTVDNQDAEATLPWLRDLVSTLGARSMVRTGLALYGYCLPIEATKPGEASHAAQPSLRPVMTWKTRIIGIRDIHPGDTVGYNAAFTAPRPMRLALLPVGYADGLRRELSGIQSHPGGWAILGDRPAPIAGRVSMNLTLIDITGLENIELGDEATVLGDHITADDHARLAHTIAYEILCGIRATPRLTP